MSIIKFLSDKTNADNALIILAQAAMIVILIISINEMTTHVWYFEDGPCAEFTNRRQDVMTEEEIEEEGKKYRQRIRDQEDKTYRLSGIKVDKHGRLYNTIDTIAVDTNTYQLAETLD